MRMPDEFYFTALLKQSSAMERTRIRDAPLSISRLGPTRKPSPLKKAHKSVTESAICVRSPDPVITNAAHFPLIPLARRQELITFPNVRPLKKSPRADLRVVVKVIERLFAEVLKVRPVRTVECCAVNCAQIPAGCFGEIRSLLLKAVAFMHPRGLFHRDIKQEN
jgi:hypothetical protein